MAQRRLKLARKGVSFYEANKSRLVTMEDDVLSIRSQIQEKWPELEVFFDEWSEEWVVIEHCGDRVDRLVLKTRRLDHDLLRMLEKADSHQPGWDIERDVDDWNSKIEKERDHRLHETLGEFVERFTFALRKDGFYGHEYISNCVGRRVDKRKVVNR